jgi:hypothetical protein
LNDGQAVAAVIRSEKQSGPNRRMSHVSSGGPLIGKEDSTRVGTVRFLYSMPRLCAAARGECVKFSLQTSRAKEHLFFDILIRI